MRAHACGVGRSKSSTRAALCHIMPTEPATRRLIVAWAAHMAAHTMTALLATTSPPRLHTTSLGYPRRKDDSRPAALIVADPDCGRRARCHCGQRSVPASGKPNPSNGCPHRYAPVGTSIYTTVSMAGQILARTPLLGVKIEVSDIPSKHTP